MTEPAAPKPGRASALLLLLALLAAACAAPPAGANHGQWFSWHHEAATGTYYANTRIERAGKIAWSRKGNGIPHNRNVNSCRDMKYSRISPSHFEIRHSRFVTGPFLQSPITVANTRTFSTGSVGDFIQVWHAGGVSLTVGVYTISIEVENLGHTNTTIDSIGCTNVGDKTTIAFTLTVAANPQWVTLSSENNVATGQFSPVRVSAATAMTPTGHRFHRNHATCSRVSVGAAANAPAALTLVRHDSGGNAVAGNDLTDVSMEGSGANDHHVRLMFKAGATLTAGVMTVTVEADGHSSCTGAAPTTDPSVEWKVTVATPAAWTNGSRHDAEAAANLKVADLNAAAADTYTGLAWQRTAAGCDSRRAQLHSDSRTIFGLHQYDGDTRQSSALANSANVTGAQEVRVYLRSSHQSHTDATLQVSMDVHGVCTIATQPWPDPVVWPVTVFAPAAWARRGADSLTAAGVFSGPELAAGSAAVDTGVRIQRSSSACASTNVVLGSSHTGDFELYRYSAAGVRQGTGAARIDGVPMPASGGDHVRLFFKAGASITAPTTLQVELNAEAHSSCTDPRTPTAASAATAAITLSDKAAWVARANDRTAPSSSFSSYDLLDAAAPTPTGVQIHRSSSACAAADVALGADTPAYLGLDVHGGASSAVELAASHDGVPMPGAGGTDRHLRLYFRQNAAVPDGTIEVTATLSAACAPASDLPDDLELVYRLRVFTPADHPWEAHDEDSQTLRAASFRQSEIRDGELATGIRLHRSSAECEATDVELLGGTRHLELVRYSAAGVADGAGAARLEAVPMSGAGDAADRHVRLRFQTGAYPPAPALEATVRIAPAASCASRRNPDPATFSYTLAIIEDVDPPPMIMVTPAGVVTIAADAAATGIRIAATDDDDDDVAVELAAASQARWSLARLGAGSYELRVRQGAALTRGARYTVEFIARDDNGEAAQSRGSATVEIDDGAPVISLSAATVQLGLNQGAAAATGLTISARDDDAANVLIAIDAAARRTFEVRSAAGGHELWVSAGVTLVQEERFTVTITATDAEGPGAERSSAATAVLAVRSGSAAATDAAAVDAGAAAVRAIGVSGIDAVLNRPAADAGPAPGAGTALLEMLAAKRTELESGEIGLRELLEGRTVSLPLNQNPAGGGAGLGMWMAGGRSDVGGVTGAEGAAVYVDGAVSSSSFGVDARFGPLLAGLGYGLHKTTAEYGYEATRAADPPSEYELDLQALQPYVAFDVGGARLALAAAAGDGRLFLRPAGQAARERLDAEYTGYALGLVQRLPVFGAGELRLRGSYAASDLDVAEPADEDQPSLDAEGSALRLALGYEHAIGFGEASSVNPFFEAGYLLLGGDGATDSSGLVAGGLAYVSGLLRASASYQQALGDEVTLEGYELSFRFSPRLGGLGLGLEANPGYGLAAAEEMFAALGAGRKLALAAEDERGLRGGAGISYGLAVAGGLLTPYGRWSAEAGRELGLRLRAGSRRSWALGYGAAADELKIEYRLGD